MRIAATCRAGKVAAASGSCSTATRCFTTAARPGTEATSPVTSAPASNRFRKSRVFGSSSSARANPASESTARTGSTIVLMALLLPGLDVGPPSEGIAEVLELEEVLVDGDDLDAE